MKSKTLFVAMVVIASFTLLACGNKGHKHASADHDHSEVVHGEGKEYTSSYVCPMHCEGSGGDSAGTCPVCGMDYVLLTDHVNDGHSHGESSDHHDHDHE